MNMKFMEVLMDKLQEQINDIDYEEIMEDVAEEIINQYVGNVEDEVRQRALEYAKQKINYESDIDEALENYMKEMLNGF